MKALLDTNILIDYLNGIEAARDEIARWQQPLISVVTWMEVIVGAGPADEAEVRGFLRRFRCIGIDAPVAEAAVALRRSRRLRLPDAVIAATAVHEGALLVTRNTRDFPADDPTVRAPYRL
jgi:predicted nucleic acid-binding protein